MSRVVGRVVAWGRWPGDGEWSEEELWWCFWVWEWVEGRGMWILPKAIVVAVRLKSLSGFGVGEDWCKILMLWN